MTHPEATDARTAGAAVGVTPRIVRPSAMVLPGRAPRRVGPRAADLREPDYDERFDADTLFYDVFRSGERVIAVGPALVNLIGAASAWNYFADGAPIGAPKWVHLDRGVRAVFPRAARSSSEITVTVPSLGWGSSLAAPDGSSESVTVGADLSDEFAGTRALMTLQLDNDLDWISDWVRWHVAAHGTDAVIVYDNGSTRYSLDELAAAIAVPGIRAAAVVDWSFKYGPLGGNYDRGELAPWDSDFAQSGAIEHARRRFLRRAAGMLSIDIDELVHTSDGRSVYAHADAARVGYVAFEGVWSYTDPAAPLAHPLHADCQWVRPTDRPTATKWCAVPSRLPDAAQASVHGIYQMYTPASAEVSYWHMRPISTHWRYDRTADHQSDGFARSALLADQTRRFLSAGDDAHPTAARRPEAASPLRELGNRLARLEGDARIRARAVAAKSSSRRKSAAAVIGRRRQRFARQIAFSQWIPEDARPALLRLGGCEIGEGVWIGSGVTVVGHDLHMADFSAMNDQVYIDAAGPVRLGKGAGFAAGCRVLTSTHEISAGAQRYGALYHSGVTIGEGTWVGASSTILPGARIGRGCIVAAGSLVRGEIPDNTLVAGVPARFIRNLPTPTDDSPDVRTS